MTILKKRLKISEYPKKKLKVKIAECQKKQKIPNKIVIDNLITHSQIYNLLRWISNQEDHHLEEQNRTKEILSTWISTRN